MSRTRLTRKQRIRSLGRSHCWKPTQKYKIKHTKRSWRIGHSLARQQTIYFREAFRLRPRLTITPALSIPLLATLKPSASFRPSSRSPKLPVQSSLGLQEENTNGLEPSPLYLSSVRCFLWSPWYQLTRSNDVLYN